MNDWAGFLIVAERSLKRADTLLTNSGTGKLPDATREAVIDQLQECVFACEQVAAWARGH